MSGKFLDVEARKAFQAAVEAVEGASAVEVVIAVRQRSGRYLHANFIVGAVVAFAALAVMLFAAYSFGLLAILIDPFVAGILAGVLVEWLPVLKRVLTPASVRHHHVTKAARAAFVERGVHNTIQRSGLLVYLSWLEQDVALVPDGGLAEAFVDDELARAAGALAAQMGAGGTAVATALAALAPKLGAAMPRSAQDLNELPDAIDSDLPIGRGRRSH